MSEQTGLELPAESQGTAPGRGRMLGRRVLVVGAGQTDYDIDGQPIGNGRATSLLLAREGAKVVAADYDEAAAAGTVDLITAAGGDATTVIADVRDSNAIEEAVARAHAWLGGLDGVVYNVGISGPVGIEALTPEAWDNTFAVNLRGAVFTARAALRVMEQGSAFVFISSTGARSSHGRIVAYAASKAGMGGLMRDIAFTGRERSIRANIVMPGGIDTGMARNEQRRERPPAREAGAPKIRPGTGWEVAYATVFLLSNEAAYITGHTLPVDGGTTDL